MKNRKEKRNRKNTRFNLLSVELNDSHVDPKTGKIGINLMFDGVNNEFKVLKAHNNEVIPSDKEVHGYFGENKTRILSEIPKDKDDHSLDLIKKLRRYDRIVAIDTNTLNVKGLDVSIGMSCHIIGKPINDNSIEWTFPIINNLFAIHGATDKPENRNWKNLIQFILNHKNYNQEHLVGIVVDSDLGNIGAFNKKECPLIDDFYLPNNFELLFASDKAIDNPLNHAIKTCHAMATKVLEKIRSEV